MKREKIKKINELIKIVRKNKVYKTPFGNPTLEECYYLYKKGISVKPYNFTLRGLNGIDFLQTSVIYNLESR